MLELEGSEYFLHDDVSLRIVLEVLLCVRNTVWHGFDGQQGQVDSVLLVREVGNQSVHDLPLVLV